MRNHKIKKESLCLEETDGLVVRRRQIITIPLSQTETGALQFRSAADELERTLRAPELQEHHPPLL